MSSTAQSGAGAGAKTGESRCLALWFPDWPVIAWSLASGGDLDSPVAVVLANRVLACSVAAAAEGVHVGQRRREAQSRCPGLKVVLADEARDARQFEPVVQCVEQLSPGVQLIDPGLCVVRARGLSRYLGDEELAAETLIEAVLTECGIDSGRVGIADGVFAAIQAARQSGLGQSALGQSNPVQVVASGGSASFLAALPISGLGDRALADLLPKLGVRTLGDFAALDAAVVRDRFGVQGVRWHALAAGSDPRRVIPRVPPPELVRMIEFESPLTLVDQVAFASRAGVEQFISGLAEAGLVCTELSLSFAGELDEFCIRTWLSPATFDAAGVLDRIRWQLQAAAGKQITSGVVSLQLEPIAVDEAGNHAPGLFGLGADERVHHAMSRVQAMLGHRGVLTPKVGGGRWLSQRQLLVAWGDRSASPEPVDRPWPGRVPDPQPSVVFADPLPVELVNASGVSVVVNSRGQLGDSPVGLRIDGRARTVIGWAGPWPVSERGWDQARCLVANRCQVVDGSGVAWLLFVNAQGWWAEARYD